MRTVGVFLVGVLLCAGAIDTTCAQVPSVPSSVVVSGVEIGQPAPQFAALDQFGQEQSNASLRGAKGTVLLFFRSADW
jgi:hypothetical protein